MWAWGNTILLLPYFFCDDNTNLSYHPQWWWCIILNFLCQQTTHTMGMTWDIISSTHKYCFPQCYCPLAHSAQTQQYLFYFFFDNHHWTWDYLFFLFILASWVEQTTLYIMYINSPLFGHTSHHVSTLMITLHVEQPSYPQFPFVIPFCTTCHTGGAQL